MTDELSEGTCRFCGARILWARNTEGRPTPIDPEPVAKNIVVVIRGVASTHHAYKSHLATCKEKKRRT